MVGNGFQILFITILYTVLPLCGFPIRTHYHIDMAASLVNSETGICIKQGNNSTTAIHTGDTRKQTNERSRPYVCYNQDKTTLPQDVRTSFTGILTSVRKIKIFDDTAKSCFYDQSHETLIWVCKADGWLKQDENKAESSFRSFLLYFHPALTRNSSLTAVNLCYKLPSVCTRRSILSSGRIIRDFLYSNFKDPAKEKRHSLSGGSWAHLCMQILCLYIIVNTFVRHISINNDFGDKTKDTGVGDERLDYRKGKRLPEQKLYDFVFSFRGNPGTHLTIYPFSLNQYANEIVKDRRPKEELMKYEWSRYLSFQTFPQDSVMTPMRLSQAGFYYTGHGEEVKCFCCGVTNGDWTTDETAIEVHRRLSPRCRFMYGESSNNVEIHNSEYYSDIYQNFRTSDRGMLPGNNETHSMITPGAAGGPADTVYSSMQNPQIHTNTSNENSQTHGQETKTNASNQTQENQTNTNTNNEQNTNIKHPEYIEVAKRHESFHGSPLGKVQDTMLMAQAGFFYAGMKDFVRCYYCGIGLKNWVKGDNPWSEHNRWSKSCGHLLHSRGERSRNHAPQDEPERSETTASSNDTTSSSGTVQNNSISGNSMAASRDPGSRSEASNDTLTIAARSVIEMGYSRETVTDAIRKYRESHKAEPPSAAAILELILDMEDEGSTSTGSEADTVSVTENQESPQSSVNLASMPATKKCTDHKTADARVLTNENKKLKERMMCKICMDRDADVVFLPCGHMVSCQACAVSLKKCAVCRKLIRGSVRVYQS